MAQAHTFSGVSIAVLERIRATNTDDYSLEFDADGVSGTVSGKTGVGSLVLRFQYAPESETITLTIVKKPMFVPFPMVWAEFSLAIRRAKSDLEEGQAMVGQKGS